MIDMSFFVLVKILYADYFTMHSRYKKVCHYAAWRHIYIYFIDLACLNYTIVFKESL